MSQEYNGWTNYETWCVALWIDNEKSSYNYWRGEAEDFYTEAGGQPSSYAKLVGEEIYNQRQRAAFNLAQALKGYHEDNAPDSGSGVYSDLLGAALSEVNWQEIAEHMLDEYPDNRESEEEEE